MIEGLSNDAITGTAQVEFDLSECFPVLLHISFPVITKVNQGQKPKAERCKA